MDSAKSFYWNLLKYENFYRDYRHTVCMELRAHENQIKSLVYFKSYTEISKTVKLVIATTTIKHLLALQALKNNNKKITGFG